MSNSWSPHEPYPIRFLCPCDYPEYWCGSPIPPPGDLPDPGIEPVCPVLQVDSLPLSHQESFMAALKSTPDHVAHTNEMYCPIILEAEVHDQVVHRVCFFWGISPWLVNGCLLPASPYDLPSVTLSPSFLFFQEITHIDLWLILQNSF